MNYLKSANFSGLFIVTFVVAATSQFAMALIGLIGAANAPRFQIFQLNGSQANTVGEAIAALAILLIVVLLMNAALSAMGSALWLLVRRLIFRGKSAEQMQASVFE